VKLVNSEPGGEITFSSTYIRACIDAGDVAAAQSALGRPHRLEGIVVRGDRRGHELGFPTANLSTPRFAAVPADGVYACWFSFVNTNGGGPMKAAVSVGTNPTFSEFDVALGLALEAPTGLNAVQIAVDIDLQK